MNFDWLNPFTQSALQQGGGGGDKAPAAPPQQKAPPPKITSPDQLEKIVEKAPEGATNEVFSGMVDDESFGGGGSSLTQAAPKKVDEHKPAEGRHLSLATNLPHLDKPRYSGIDELDLMGEATLDRRIKAVGNLNQELIFDQPEGDYTERDHNRKQWNTRGSLAADGRLDRANDAQLGAVDINLGTRGATIAYNTPVKDIESATGRVEALNMLVQNRDPNDPNFDATGDAACAGATIVGAMLYSKGRKGLSMLLGAVAKGGEEEPPEVKKLREKLENKGEQLTISDLQQLQSLVYHKMKESEGEDDQKKLEEQLKSDDPAEKAKAFVHGKTIDDFIENLKMKDGDSTVTLKGIFQENHLDVAAIDNTGDEKGDHVVLRISDEKNKVVAYYDPWMKHGKGGQIVNAQDGRGEDSMGRIHDPDMEDYTNATSVSYGFDGTQQFRK